MANSKISALTELAAANVASGDMIPIVDVSDTTHAASGTTKRVAAGAFAQVGAANTFTQDQTVNANLTAQRFITRTDSIADDGVVSFSFGLSAVGMIILSSTTFGDSVPGIIHFRAASSPTCTKIAGGSNLNVTTGVLTGTTGTNGRVTVSCTDGGVIYIENRMGSTMSIRTTFLG